MDRPLSGLLDDLKHPALLQLARHWLSLRHSHGGIPPLRALDPMQFAPVMKDSWIVDAEPDEESKIERPLEAELEHLIVDPPFDEWHCYRGLGVGTAGLGRRNPVRGGVGRLVGFGERSSEVRGLGRRRRDAPVGVGRPVPRRRRPVRARPRPVDAAADERAELVDVEAPEAVGDGDGRARPGPQERRVR